MTPFSCSNCCFNSLQYGSFGLSAGYCVEHRLVLRQADETTCGKQLRKDLLLRTAEAVQKTHGSMFDEGSVRFLRTTKLATTDPHAVSESTTVLETDAVGEAVSEYGTLDSKNESLVRLRSMTSARAELAVLSLGRTYVRRCTQRDGDWTSSLGILWWARKRLSAAPSVALPDLRFQTAPSLDRQAELVAWSLVMLRLTFVSDVGFLAPSDDPVSRLADIADMAADASETPDLPALLAWLHEEGQSHFDTSLPLHRFKALRTDLHKD